MRIAFDHPLAMAARELDTISEEQGFRALFETLGLDREDVIYMAQQRALRVALIVAGRTDLLGHDKLMEIPQGVIDPGLLQDLTLCALDSINIGWKARGISDAHAQSVPEL